MFCPNCGTQVDQNAAICPNCGTPISAQPAQGTDAAQGYGPNAGYTDPNAAYTQNQGYTDPNAQQYQNQGYDPNAAYNQNQYNPNQGYPNGQYPPQPPAGGYQQKEKLVAGLLGIFLGSFGIHNFYLGFTTKAIIQIVVTIVTCGIGGLWGFIEGILILTGNINVDANGIPLKG